MGTRDHDFRQKFRLDQMNRYHDMLQFSSALCRTLIDSYYREYSNAK